MANDLSAFDAQAWSKRLVMKLDPINVMLPLVNKDWEGELQNIGDTVNIRTPGNITMGAYTKGATITYQDLSPTKEAFTIADAEFFAFKVDDIEKAQTDLNAMDIYMGRAVVALNNVIEAKLLAQYTKVLAGNKVDNGSGGGIVLDSGTSTATGIYQQFVKARTLLAKQNVPNQGRWAIIDPDRTALILEDTSHFIRSTEFGDRVVIDGTMGIRDSTGNIRPGFVGRCAGFDVYESVNLPVVAGTPNNTFLFFGDNDLITYAAQLREIEALRLQTTFGNAVRGLLLHDATVLAENSKRGVTVRVVQ